MVNFGTRLHGDSKRRPLVGLGLNVHKAEWMESGADPLLSPTVFLVEQPAHTTLVPHFHRQNQFQLFVEGGGTIGSSPLQPFTVHYAGAYTGYGPLVAGAEGIKYFTIRPVCESGAVRLEDAREHMVRGPKRHATSRPITPTPSAQLAALVAPSSYDAIPVADDGLGARVVRAPPHGSIATEFPATAQGTFIVVLCGSIRHAAGELGLWESVFASTQQELPALSAGDAGAEVIFLFTPPRSEAYR